MMAFGLTWRDALIVLLIWRVFVLTMVLLMLLAANAEHAETAEHAKHADAAEIADARRIAAEDGPVAGFEPSELAPVPAPLARPLAQVSSPSGASEGGLVPASCLVVTSWGGTWGDLVPVRRVVVPSGCLLN